MVKCNKVEDSWPWSCLSLNGLKPPLDNMASQINIYSQLSISTIRTADINNSNCCYWYLIVDICNYCRHQQLKLSISAIRIMDIHNFNCRYQQLWMLPKHREEYVIHMVATRAGAGLSPKKFVFPCHKERKKLIRIHIYAWIRIVDIHNSNYWYPQF